MHDDHPDLRARLREASRSFRKGDARHVLRTPEVMYCAFTTPMFSVSRQEAQRDAATRLTRFGLDAASVGGKTALDLGCNAGAMLFQLSSLGIDSGLGIEYDADKIDLAREIARLSGLSHLGFEQGDIDGLEAPRLGQFDFTLALAIEAHVLRPKKLFGLLAQTTRDRVLFEGNGNCDVAQARDSFMAAGFSRVDYLGFCDDDIVPSNNKRPLMVAWK